MNAVWLAIWRVALLAFPRGFRRRWGASMTDTFHDGLRSRSPLDAALYAVRECAATVGAGIRERAHLDVRQLQMLHLHDVRYAGRLLTRSPGFSLLTILVLAGGLGLSTFTFSFLHTAMYKAVPLGEGDRIARLLPTVDGRVQPLDAVDAAMLRASMRSMRELAGYGAAEVVMGTDGARRVVDAVAADPVLFSVARTPAWRGRTLLPSDSDPGAAPVMVLTHRSWEVALGSDPEAVGSLVMVNGTPTQLVGVMPPGFGFPVASEGWIPLPSDARDPGAPGRQSLQLLGRLAPGATASEASAEATALLQRALQARDTTGGAAQRLVVRVESLPAAQIGEERGIAFAALNGIALLILVLALVNVTNLLLARANERVRETAVRMALGASIPRLVMQGLWESVLLCLVGGLIGTAGAAWGLEAITRWTQANMEGNLAFWWVWQMDRTGLLVAGGLVTLAMAVLGVAVSWRAARTNVREVMQDGTARSGSRREGRIARALVVTQVVTVTVLMFFGVLSGVMARRLMTVDPGYDTTHLLQAAIEAPADRYATADSRRGMLQRLGDQLAERGELEGALLRRRLAGPPDAQGQVALAGDGSRRAPAWVHALQGDPMVTGVRVLEGRGFVTSDDGEHAPVVLVSRSFAQQAWPGRSPVGEQVRLTVGADTTTWRTVVGVVSDVPYGDPWSWDRREAAYVPLAQVDVDGALVFVRHRGSEVAGREAIFRAVAGVDPLLVPGQVQPVTQVLATLRLVTVGVTKLFAAAFALALLLAVVGSYGLMARAIGLRTREIGVRRAMGATDSMITRLLLGQGARQLGIGALLALPLLVMVGAAFNHFFPVGPASTAVAAVLVPLSIVGVVLASTWVPTRKVLRVPPRDALWRE